MAVASLAQFEEDRLKNLYSHDILDTEPEPEFEQIVKIARDLCKVPICLISLVDRDRQWFKARLGIEVCETSREVSFCSHAVAARDILLVADALDDPRFQRNPFVVGEPKIRFYLGIPLMSERGYPLGTLCVIDTTPRKLENRQIEMLISLSELTGILLTRRKNRQVNTGMTLVKGQTPAEEVKDYSRFYQAVFARTLRNFAHEVNNPLAIALGGSEQLLERLNQDGKVADTQVITSMEMIQSSTLRISETFRSYLRLILQAHEGQEYQSINPMSYLNDVLNLFQSKLRNLGMSYEIHCQIEQKSVALKLPETSVLLFGSILYFLTQQGSGLKRAHAMNLKLARDGDQITLMLQYTERKNDGVEKSGESLVEFSNSLDRDIGQSLLDIYHLAQVIQAEVKLCFDGELLASLQLWFKEP